MLFSKFYYMLPAHISTLSYMYLHKAQQTPLIQSLLPAYISTLSYMYLHRAQQTPLIQSLLQEHTIGYGCRTSRGWKKIMCFYFTG